MRIRSGCALRHGQRGGGASRAARWSAWRLVALSLAAAALLGLPLVGLASPVAHASGGTLTIVRPASGPVGANVVVKVASALPSHQYNLGFAPQSGTCADDFAPFAGVSLTTADDGTRTTSFVWPADSTMAQGTSYYVCAQDAANSANVLQSNNAYQVLATTAPSISVAPAQPPTSASSGTPMPTAGTNPDGSYSVGQQVTVTGSNFLPGGQSIGIWLSGTVTALGTRLTIEPVAGQSDVSDTSGAFTVTVTLPAGRIGQGLYLHAATLDATSHLPPTLVAHTSIAIEPAPTPTPSPSPSPSPTVTTPLTPTTPSTDAGSSDALRIAGVVGLGALSALLLIVGVILLASAAAMPRQQ